MRRAIDSIVADSDAKSARIRASWKSPIASKQDERDFERYAGQFCVRESRIARIRTAALAGFPTVADAREWCISHGYLSEADWRTPEDEARSSARCMSADRPCVHEGAAPRKPCALCHKPVCKACRTRCGDCPRVVCAYCLTTADDCDWDDHHPMALCTRCDPLFTVDGTRSACLGDLFEGNANPLCGQLNTIGVCRKCSNLIDAEDLGFHALFCDCDASLADVDTSASARLHFLWQDTAGDDRRAARAFLWNYGKHELQALGLGLGDEGAALDAAVAIDADAACAQSADSESESSEDSASDVEDAASAD